MKRAGWFMVSQPESSVAADKPRIRKAGCTVRRRTAPPVNRRINERIDRSL